MSCIVAVAEGEKIWMGCDSATCSSNRLTLPRDHKIFSRISQGIEWFVGVVGMSRVLQVVHYQMDFPTKAAPGGKALCGFLVREFIPLLRKVLGENGLIIKKDNIEKMDGNLIVGVNGRIFQTDDSFHILERMENFTALGSGLGEAFGVLFATKRMKPRERLLLALQASAATHPDVRAPFHIIHNKK